MKLSCKYLHILTTRSASTCRQRRSGQTLFELMTMIFGIIGAFVGGFWAAQRGWYWGFLGTFVGFTVGFVINALLWMVMLLLALCFDPAGRAEIAAERAEIAKERAAAKAAKKEHDAR